MEQSLRDEIAHSSNPAQLLLNQFGIRMTEEQIRQFLQKTTTAEQWTRFINDSKTASERQKSVGGDSEHQYARKDEHGNILRDEQGHAVYDEDRKRLVHAPIVDEWMQKFRDAEKNLEGAPELVVLAGRGGSGKSGFGVDPKTGKPTNWHFGFYDSSYVVLDPDEFKKDLAAAAAASGAYPKDASFNPAQDGAGYWHEESSYLMKQMQQRYLEELQAGRKANVVFDLTLNSDKSKPVSDYKRAGMHVTMAMIVIPAKNSALNAYNRYLGGKRLVPINVIASSKNNEKNFDDMLKHEVDDKGTKMVDSWYLYTAGEEGQRHRLLASGGSSRPRGIT